MKRAAILAALAFATLTPAALAAGTSQQKQAAAQACFVRADIGSDAATFPAMVVAPGTPADVRLTLQHIRADLATIKSTLPNLAPPLRRQMAVASVAFIRQLGRLVPGLLRAPAGAAPLSQFARFRAAQSLTTPVYQRTLGQVACS